MLFSRSIEYLRALPAAKMVLWCYVLWYLSMACMHFDASPRLWLNSLGIAVVIGVGLILSVAGAHARPDFWTMARLFMMPFGVSSFSALIKDRGFVLIFSPVLRENAVALGACLLFFLVSRGVRWTGRVRIDGRPVGE